MMHTSKKNLYLWKLAYKTGFIVFMQIIIYYTFIITHANIWILIFKYKMLHFY